MAYVEHGMWEVLEVLRRIHRGEAVRSVSRSTGRSPKTVRRYVRRARKLGWVAGEGEPSEELAAAVLSRLRPGPGGESPGETEAILTPHLEQLRRWLCPDDSFGRGLTLTKVHGLLHRRAIDVSYISLYRFVHKHLDFGRNRGTVRVADVRPGELAEVDFGRLGTIYDPEANRSRVVHALIVTLVFSRHQYVHLTHGQKVADLIAGLEDAWESFGGVTSRVVIDNMKAAVLKADRYEPAFQRTFEEYARYRGFVLDPTVSRHATGKPHVERQVPYVRENFFRGETFVSLEHARDQARHWCLTTAGLRTHGTTRKQPLAQFDLLEKPVLAPLERERFDTPAWGEPKVHPDCHVRFQYALYSVPYRYRGYKTTVRSDSKIVRIYVRGELVKTHPRQPPGGRSTDPEDYPPTKSAYAMRDADFLIRKARERGDSIGRFLERLLDGDFPWAKLRQAQQLLRLTDKYGEARLEAACRRALHFDLVNVRRVKEMVERAIEAEGSPACSSPAPVGPTVQRPLRFLRDARSFNHHGSSERRTRDGRA